MDILKTTCQLRQDRSALGWGWGTWGARVPRGSRKRLMCVRGVGGAGGGTPGGPTSGQEAGKADA